MEGREVEAELTGSERVAVKEFYSSCVRWLRTLNEVDPPSYTLPAGDTVWKHLCGSYTDVVLRDRSILSPAYAVSGRVIIEVTQVVQGFELEAAGYGLVRHSRFSFTFRQGSCAVCNISVRTDAQLASEPDGSLIPLGSW